MKDLSFKDAVQHAFDNPGSKLISKEGAIITWGKSGWLCYLDGDGETQTLVTVRPSVVTTTYDVMATAEEKLALLTARLSKWLECAENTNVSYARQIMNSPERALQLSLDGRKAGISDCIGQIELIMKESGITRFTQVHQ